MCHQSKKPDRDRLAELVVGTVVRRTLIHDLKAGPHGRGCDPGVLEEIFRRLCRYAGESVRPHRIREEVAQVLGPGVRDKTVTDALQFLSSALLIHEIPPLEALAKKQTHPPKICLCDHFVREAWSQEKIPILPKELARANQAVSTRAGHIIESDIGYYLRGIPGLSVSWFPARPSEPEVDFVLTIGLQRIPIEVKYCRGKPGHMELAGLRSFCSQEKYNAPFGLLITQKDAGELDDSTIAIPAYVLLSVR